MSLTAPRLRLSFSAAALSSAKVSTAWQPLADFHCGWVAK